MKQFHRIFFNEIGYYYYYFRKLQGNAIEKLKARETLTQSGQIELKLKLDKHIKQNHPNLENPMKIQIDTNFDGDDLAEMISKKVETPKEMLKLVSAGAVIKTNTKLSDLKPGQTVMVLTVDHNSEAVKIGKRSIYMPLKNMTSSLLLKFFFTFSSSE